MQNKEHQEEKRIRLIAIGATILFHGLMFLALFFLAFRTPLPLPGEEGVEVNLGYSDQGMGDIQPEESSLLKSSQPPSSHTKADEQLVTENNEESPALEKVQKKAAEKTNVTTPKTNPEPDMNKQPEVNPNALFKGKSNKNVTGGNQGITGQPGDQGKSFGTPDGSGYDGLGGKGNGISYDLGGRGARNIPKPLYNKEDQGSVVVTIWVNREGRVTRVQGGARGTTIADQKLIAQCEDAARRTIFAPDPSAPEEQKGTITYKFLIVN